MPELLHREIIERNARECALPVALIAAIIQVESGWNTWAIRFEPAFLKTYVQMHPERFGPGISRETERIQRATSFGLMQVMGQTARELGAKQTFLTELCRPEIGIHLGCRYLARQRARFEAEHGLDGAIAAYNAGSPRRNESGEFFNAPYVAKVRGEEAAFA
jgi:soluble lytic murein transglycosylase-like protein